MVVNVKIPFSFSRFSGSVWYTGFECVQPLETINTEVLYATTGKSRLESLGPCKINSYHLFLSVSSFTNVRALGLFVSARESALKLLPKCNAETLKT